MRRSVLALVLAGSVAVAACGSAKTATPAFVESTPATTQAVTTTAAQSTATATTVAATTSILITTTTAAPATTVLALPAQPVDDEPGTAVEPATGPGVGRIEIPRLGVDQRLQNNWDLNSLDFGPGLMPGSPRPGQVGNMVVAGHRTSHSKPFRYIDTLQNGDEVVFTIKDRRTSTRSRIIWTSRPMRCGSPIQRRKPPLPCSRAIHRDLRRSGGSPG